jgi:hypothetical protein
VTALRVLIDLAPVLVLLCVLALGRYPGERAFRRLVARRRAVRRRLPRAAPRRRDAAALLPRGGALLASALAGRAPPAGPA